MANTLYSDAVVSLIIRCPTLGREATATIDYARGDVYDCELCGSHGSVEVEVRCECGSMHTIELNGW